MTPRLQIPRHLIPLCLLLLVSAAACGEDPTEPQGWCDDVLNDCREEGFDLAIVEAELRFDDDQPFETEVDAHVVEPGDLVTARFRIVNRGTLAAPAARIAVTDELYAPIASMPIPALEPGDERTIDVEFESERIDAWPEILLPVFASLITDSTHWYEDALYDNNFAHEVANLVYHPLVPILTVELVGLPDTVRAAHPYVLSATVTNLSPFVAANDVALGICIYPGNVECTDQPDGELASTGSIPAGDSRLIALQLLAQQSPFDMHHPEREIEVGVCFPSPDGWAAGIDCAPGSWLPSVLMPNLDAACDAPQLTAPVVFEASTDAAECSTDPAAGFARFLYAFDAEAGDEFRFTAQDSVAAGTHLEFYTVEASFLTGGGLHEPLVFSAPAAGRYYVETTGDGGEILFEEL